MVCSCCLIWRLVKGLRNIWNNTISVRSLQTQSKNSAFCFSSTKFISSKCILHLNSFRGISTSHELFKKNKNDKQKEERNTNQEDDDIEENDEQDEQEQEGKEVVTKGVRLDIFLKGISKLPRDKGKLLILQKRVTVNGVVVSKPAKPIKPTDIVKILDPPAITSSKK
jgi:predicted rRNA methylase YqxC with S4 and FtsJ domains